MSTTKHLTSRGINDLICRIIESDLFHTVSVKYMILLWSLDFG